MIAVSLSFALRSLTVLIRRAIGQHVEPLRSQGNVLDLDELADHFKGIIKPRNWPDEDMIFPLEAAEITYDDRLYSTMNYRRLLGGSDVNEHTPMLSIEKSQQRVADALCRDKKKLRIVCRYDVDSMIARATSLAVFKGSFKVSWTPAYLRRVTQNPRVKFEGE